MIKAIALIATPTFGYIVISLIVAAIAHAR